MPKFIIEYDVRGTISHIVTADTSEDAAKIAHDYSGGDEDFSEAMYEIEDLTDVDYSIRQMTRVRDKDGTIRLTTYVFSTDEVLPDEDAEVLE
jgi:hypothetical protein